MAIAQALGRMATTLVAIVQTRLTLAALRPKRVLPLLAAGGALWKSVGAVLPLVHKLAARLGRQRPV